MNPVSSCCFYTYTLMMQISIYKIIPNPGRIEISTLNLPIKTSAEMTKKGGAEVPKKSQEGSKQQTTFLYIKYIIVW